MTDSSSIHGSGGTAQSLCPICRRPAQQGYRPFCSRRCADVDLARWFKGVYRIQVDDPEAETRPEEEA